MRFKNCLSSVWRQYQHNQRGRGRKVERDETSERQWEHDGYGINDEDIQAALYLKVTWCTNDQENQHKLRTRAEEGISRETE